MKKLLLAVMFLCSSVLANGTLQVTSQSIMPSVVPMNAIGIPMLRVNLTAENETIYVDKLIFKRTGLSSAQDITSIRATGTTLRSRSFSMLNDDTATVRFFGKLVIPENTTQSLIITANVNIQGVGRTVGLELVEIVSSASQSTVDESEANQEEKTVSSSFQQGSLEIEKLPFTPSRLRLERWQKLGKFQVKNTDGKRAVLDSFYVTNYGTGNLTDIFHDLLVTSQNSVISELDTFSGKTARFSFLPDTTVAANSDRLLEIWGKIKRNKSTYTVDFGAENDDITIK